MRTFPHKPSRPITIEEHSEPTVRWYVVSDMDEHNRCSFEIDAYVVGFDDGGDPDDLDVLFVVVIATRPNQPNFLYAPSDLSGRALTAEAAIKRALAAYHVAYPGLIRALGELSN